MSFSELQIPSGLILENNYSPSASISSLDEIPLNSLTQLYSELKLLRDTRQNQLDAAVNNVKGRRLVGKQLTIKKLIEKDQNFMLFCGRALQSTAACLLYGTISICSGFIFLPCVYVAHRLRQSYRQLDLFLTNHKIEKLARNQFRGSVDCEITPENCEQNKIGFDRLNIEIKFLKKKIIAEKKAEKAVRVRLQNLLDQPDESAAKETPNSGGSISFGITHYESDTQQIIANRIFEVMVRGSQ